MTYYLYLLIVFCYLFCHIDLGILAVSNENIIKSMDIEESAMGLLATGLYIGNVVGSLICPFLFAKMKAKYLIVAAGIVNAGAVAVFTFIQDYWIVFASRIVVGLAQVVFIIYFPVWIDQQAPPKSQTMWISFYFLTVPVGLIVGYLCTVNIFPGEHDWKWSFLIQTALMIVPTTILFIVFPAKYYEKGQEHSNMEASVELSNLSALLVKSNSKSIDAIRTSVGMAAKMKKSHHLTFSVIEKQPLPIGTILKNLMLNPSYILSVLAITNVMFILTALEYWATQYATTVLNGEPTFVFISFSGTVITAPCIGAITGGIITTKFLGSYTNKKSLYMCFVVYILFMAFCVPCPLMSDYTYFIILVWLAIFMQGFIEPIMMGIILNTVTPLERPTASSLSILIEMGVGMMPAPYLYGLAQKEFKTLNEDGVNVSRAGMYLTFYSSVIGGVCLLFALILKNRSYKQSAERMK